MADVLQLGGIAFTGYSTPDVMMGGGRQAMVIHKLPGGMRVIDTLGPDEANVAWRGHLYDDGAYNMALELDAMRAAGSVLPLTWGGQYRSVIIDEFIYRVRRLPIWVDYTITCVVVNLPAFGGGGVVTSSFDDLITSDLTLATGL
jgi:hypothetical protein